MKRLSKKNLGCDVGIKDIVLVQSRYEPIDPEKSFYLVGFKTIKKKQYGLVKAFDPDSSNLYLVLATKIIL